MHVASMEDKKEKALIELRQEGIQRTLDQLHDRALGMISFTLQWKDMEEHLEYTHNAMEERARELRAIQDSTKERLELAEKKEEELERIRESVNEGFRGIEAREKEFELSQKKEIEETRREIEWIEKSGRELDAVRDLIEKKLSEVKELEEKFVFLNSCIEERVSDVRVVEGKVYEKIKEIEVKEKEIELKEKEIEARLREVELKEKKLEECFKEVELKEKGIEERCREVELKEKKFKEVKIEPLDDNCDMDYLANDASIRFWVKMDGKDMQIFLNERWEQHHKMKNEVEIVLGLSSDPAKLVLDAMQGYYPPHLKKGDVEFEEAAVRSSCNLLLEQLMKISPPIKPPVRKEAMKIAFDWMTKMRKDAEHSVEILGFLQLLATYGLASAFDADELLSCLKIVAQHSEAYELGRVIGFADKVSGWDLQIFLNERWKKHNSLRNEVKITLGLSSDPAKLVLDAMYGFYPPHLKKGDVEFEEVVIRRSCILLLEMLLDMSPPIKPHVRKAAMRLAFDWMTKMRKDAEHSLEVLGLLQLLATYDLASAFDADELLNYLEIVTPHRQSPELARILGFANKVSGIVQNLLGKNRLTEAIKFIYEFELVNAFPLVSVLKAYLKYSRSYAKQIKRGSKSLEAKIEATKKVIDDLTAVLRCIEDHKIKFEISPEKLKQEINFLEKENAKRKTILPALGCTAQSPYLNQNNCFLPNVIDGLAPGLPLESASITSTALVSSSAPASNAAPISRTASQQQSGIKRPWAALSEEDDRNAHIGASGVTSISLTGQQPTGLCAGQVSCTVPNMGGEDLSLLLNKHGNYELIRDEVFDALQHACNPAKLVLDVIRNLCPSNVKFKLDVSKESYILLLEQLRRVSPQIKPQLRKKAKKFAMVWKSKLAEKAKDPLEVICFLQFLAAYGLASSFYADEVFDALQHACNPAKLVLDVIRNLCPFNVKFKLDVSKESYILLLEQLRRVSPQIKPQLKKNAKKFAMVWKSKLAEKAKDPLEVICFLQFLAAYGLASSFNADELRGLLHTDHWHKMAPDLCQILGLADMIPNFIQNLIRRKQQIEAIKYIYSLDMVGKFPPAPLLNDYLGHCSKLNAKRLSKKNTIGVQIGAIERELKALKAVAKCIADYKIESGFSLEILEERITKLEKEKEQKILKKKEEKISISENSKTKIGPWSKSESELSDQQREKQYDSPTTAHATNITNAPTISSLAVPASTMVTSSAPTSASVYTSIPTTQPQQQSGNKRPRIAVSSSAPPKASVVATSMVDSMQLPHPQPPSWFTNQGVLNMNSSAMHYNLSTHPPNNVQSSSYYPSVIPYYHWNTFGNPGPGHDKPVPF